MPCSSSLALCVYLLKSVPATVKCSLDRHRGPQLEHPILLLRIRRGVPRPTLAAGGWVVVIVVAFLLLLLLLLLLLGRDADARRSCRSLWHRAGSAQEAHARGQQGGSKRRKGDKEGMACRAILPRR